MDEAVRYHQNGRLAEAEGVYRRVLSADPRHADSLHLLGLIAHQAGRNDAAVDLIGKAIGINRMVAEYHSNLGESLRAEGNLDAALAAYDNAICVKPNYAEAYSNRGNVLRYLGRLEEALEACDAAIRIKSDYAEAHSNRGNALMDLGRPGDALVAYDAALGIRPGLVQTCYNRGNALRDLGRLSEALAAYDITIRIKPDYAEAHCNRGVALKELSRLDDALASYDTALRIKPDYAEAHSNRGNALKDLGRLNEALAAYDTALRIRPDSAEAHYNQSLALFLRGDLQAGWDKYEWRWRGGSKDLNPRDFSCPPWDGAAIAGRSILLHAEQGLGDTIQFCRYAPLVAALGGRVVLEAPRRLLRVLSGLAGVRQLVADGDPLPAFDLHCPLMSLPGRFGTTVESIPADIPYLSAEPERVTHWRKRLASDDFKIGIVWQGGPNYKADSKRSVPLACFAPLAELSGVRLISLQKVHGLEQLQHLPHWMKVTELGEDFDTGPDAFVDTAAVMMDLDLVVTVDTAIGHLAGALGRPVWIAVQAVPHWVWMLDRDDSPWYPSVRLFRQTVRGDWDGVFFRMAAELADLLQDRPSPRPDSPTPPPSGAMVTVPVSLGELIDKVTILEIKATRISDPGKNRNVREELRLLKAVLAGQRASPGLARLTRELRRANEALWDIEDAIRDCERRSDFGPRFVELARSVYRSNDRRAEIKKEINRVLGSGLMEEKSYSPYQTAATAERMPGNRP